MSYRFKDNGDFVCKCGSTIWKPRSGGETMWSCNSCGAVYVQHKNTVVAPEDTTTIEQTYDEAVIETMRSQIEQLTSELTALKKTNKEQDERLRGWENKAAKPCTECKLRGAALEKWQGKYAAIRTQANNK